MLTNRAIPASTAFMFATCLQHHVPEVRGNRLLSCPTPFQLQLLVRTGPSLLASVARC